MIVVFAGSTTAPNGHCRMAFLPPARRGDVFSAASDSATDAIVLIDGYFGEVPSVLHKELLWALSRGVPVYGAASMGALRASEMFVYGMRGHGWIYEAYRRGHQALLSGVGLDTEESSLAASIEGSYEAWLRCFLEHDALTHDDDVALRFLPAELGYGALSEPLVNIMCTVRLSPASDQLKREALLAAKRRYFPERSYDLMFADLRADCTIDPLEITELEAWVVDHKVNQKRIDASDLLDRLSRGEEIPGIDPEGGVEFVETEYWADLCKPQPRDEGSAIPSP